MLKRIAVLGWISFICLLLSACTNHTANPYLSTISSPSVKPDTVVLPVSEQDTTTIERYLISRSLVNIHDLDTSIRVVLHYSTNQNFLHQPIYKGLTHCYLPCEVAIKLCNAQAYLKMNYPDYNIIVFDAVRPLHIQKKMWKELDMPDKLKINYLAHPDDISLHNYGAAVDVGIIGLNHVLIDMGTDFDRFDELSQPKLENKFLEEGKLTATAYKNRLILRQCMVRAGFMTIPTEWWHFNATNKITAAKQFELIE